jgi:hypothetical protein
MNIVQKSNLLICLSASLGLLPDSSIDAIITVIDFMTVGINIQIAKLTSDAVQQVYEVTKLKISREVAQQAINQVNSGINLIAGKAANATASCPYVGQFINVGTSYTNSATGALNNFINMIDYKNSLVTAVNNDIAKLQIYTTFLKDFKEAMLAMKALRTSVQAMASVR